ncbi:unnamed protein product [Rotaria sordida]|uniref:F-box domain-containing protein n=1 Tax=Rotaria sordida TaxID=392033 RepID=A0A819N384_9BILA|nr:unnamed protein product [Rotaria sordida]
MITCFEDLSNEMFYELFDFFDSYDIYEIFSNLNSRFNHLIIHSSLPLRLNFSCLSKTSFQHRCNTILMPNVHRIISLQFSHHLIIDDFFTSFCLDSSFIRLEILILQNIKSDNLIPILTTLALLPRLYSLTITSIEKIQSSNDVFCLIIRLPVLKYCKLSFELWNQYINLSLNNNEYSSIEHLIINTKYNLDQLNNFLIYTPNLHCLSCEISTLNSKQITMSIISMNLINLYLKLEDTSFDEFEWFIIYFSHQLKLLHLSTQRDIEFLNADRWEQLILCHMLNLRKFNFRHQIINDENIINYHRYHLLIDKFKSSFWIDRQWFFTHHHYKSKDFTSWIIFYSIQPYRWNHYDFYEDRCQYYETGFNLAYEVDLHNYSSIIPYSIKFLRTNRLILSGENINENPSFIFDLTHIFLPTQLTELIISDKTIRLEQLQLFLHYFPNIKLLKIPTSILYLCSPQSETKRIIFNKNNIIKINLINQCTLEDIQILNRFCPYIHSLEIETDKENLELILYFLLRINTNRNHQNRSLTSSSYSKNIIFWQQDYSTCIHCMKKQNLNSFQSPCNHHLSSICFRDVNYMMVKKLRTKIDLDALLDDYTLEYLDQNMYMWW